MFMFNRARDPRDEHRGANEIFCKGGETETFKKSKNVGCKCVMIF